MKLKVCGARTMAMVQACQDLSVPYIGFNFVPTSKRLVDLETAHTLSHAFTGKKVGVFQNQSLEAIFETAQIVDLDIIQLHGHETPDFISKLKQLFDDYNPCIIWKAFSADKIKDSLVLQQYSENCGLFLFDGSIPGSGNTINDIKNLKNLVITSQNLNKPFGLAGGVNINTVTNFLAHYPTATLLDTASGVETNGEFDRSKLETLLHQLQDV